MRSRRLIALVIVAAVVVIFGVRWYINVRHHTRGDSIVVYYTKTDGTSEIPWRVTLGPARDLKSVAAYAAAQVLAGPATDVEAVRFPPGTHVRALEIDGSTIDLDLSGEVAKSAQGGFAENAEFKALVWTLTEPKTLPGINTVRIRVDGTRVATLPGGHFELDEPLTRTTF